MGVGVCKRHRKAISEICRVTKQNGYIAIGAMHHPSSMNIDEYNRRKKHDDRLWYGSVKSILNSFNVYMKISFSNLILKTKMRINGVTLLLYLKIKEDRKCLK